MTESQLETWSHQGAVSGSRDTYHSIRNVLNDPLSSYSGRGFEVYLQGSYGNDTNIWSESDVDVVIELTQSFTSNKKSLPPDQLAAHEVNYKAAEYTQFQFRNEVLSHLRHYYGANYIIDGKRSIKIAGNGSRRDADVVVCQSYRHYQYYFDDEHMLYLSGMEIRTTSGSVVNFPMRHSSALTEKNKSSHGMLKPTIRVLKNIRRKMVDVGLIGEKDTCSYYLESWLYNAPDNCFVSNIKNAIEGACNWLIHNDELQYSMPHGVWALIGDSDSQWKHENYRKFTRTLASFYNSWEG